jgi:hypothetical protein
MKLSAAILLGSTLREQCFGRNFIGGGSCAFGAAYEALGYDQFNFPDYSNFWPWLDVPVECPVCGGLAPTAATIISAHLNDDHKWTRERIAEWVATVEPQDIQGELWEIRQILENIQRDQNI